MTLMRALASVAQTGGPGQPGIPSQLLSVSDEWGRLEQNGRCSTQNIWSDDTHQYVAFYAGTTGLVTVGQRELDSETFSFFTLADDPDDVFGATTINDGHYTTSICTDSDGYIHLVANTYLTTTVKYMRSTSPGNITSWDAATMAKPAGNFSYASFIKCADGELLMMFRIGSSLDGDSYIYAYNTSTQVWTQRVHFSEPGTSTDNMYWGRVDVGTDGRIHLWSTWRRNVTAALPGNQDIQYAYSDNNGVTWRKKSDGSALTLPIEYSTGEVVASVAESLHMYNASGSCVDADGNPHSVWKYDDGSGYVNYWHHWHNGSSWQAEKITDWSDLAGGTLATDIQISRPSIGCFTDGTLWVLYRSAFDTWASTVSAIDVTTPGSPSAPFQVADVPCDTNWEPTIDLRLLESRNQMTLLVGPTNENIGFSPVMTAQGYLLAVRSDASLPLQIPTTNFPVAPLWHAWWADGAVMGAEGYADTDAVVSWPRERGRQDLAEATNAPSYDAVVAALNDQAAVSFDGTNDVLNTSTWSPTDDQPYSVSFIVNVREVEASMRFIEGNATERALVMTGSSAPYYWQMFSGTVVSSAVEITTGPHVVTANFDDGSSSLWLDGVEILSAQTTGTNGIENLRLGTGLTPGTYSAIDYALVGIGPILSDAQIGLLHDWSSTYYGTP